MIVVQRDYVKWCAMLVASLQGLGCTPSTEVGAFYEKAMGIDDHDQRLMFFNRGQDWVVRRLDALTPRVEDNVLLGDLVDMHRAHIENIDEIESLLSARGFAGR
jgi:hypothetical protein